MITLDQPPAVVVAVALLSRRQKHVAAAVALLSLRQKHVVTASLALRFLVNKHQLPKGFSRNEDLSLCDLVIILTIKN
jgi:hypothetical protein